MKKFFASGLIMLLIVTKIYSQIICPGGGRTFSAAVTFNQSLWTAPCSNSTTCTGGIQFDNRSSCEPTTAMEACGPDPSCTTPSENGSDLWFKFYATSTSVTIKVIQNISFVAAIQAFSGSSCGTLSEIGCIKAGSPTGGIALNLSGLTVNQLYYYRVFGSSSTPAQRTGTFCFCGSSGLGSLAVLPVVLTSFSATVKKNNVQLSWRTASEPDNKYFELQHSIDGNNFTAITTIAAKGAAGIPSEYSFNHFNAMKGINYYRLKQVDLNGGFKYSDIITAKMSYGNLISLYPSPAKEKLVIQSSVSANAVLLNQSGQRLQLINLVIGRNEVPVSKLNSGVYFIRLNSEIQKFNVIK
jgi:hypothetical protein